MERKQLWISAGISLVVLAILIAGWLLSPRVVSYSPAGNAVDVIPSSQISITFSLDIKQQPNLDYLQINPPTPGTYKVDKKTITFSPAVDFQPDEQVSVQVNPKIKSALGLSVWQPPSWTFSVKHPWLLYLLDSPQRTELYQIDPQGLQPQKLVITDASIVDYTVGPKGHSVVYAAVDASNNTGIYVLDVATNQSTLIHDCGKMICSRPEISPDGSYLTFVSGSSPQEQLPAASRVWLVRLNGLSQVGKPFLVAGSEHPTRDPTWSSAGWMEYYDDNDQNYVFYNPSNGKRQVVQHDTGELGSWSADGTEFLYPRIVYPEQNLNAISKYSSQLFSFNPETGATTPFTQNNTTEDVQPLWSADGKWVAFARRSVLKDEWTPGRQIWIVRSDGNNARSMTNSGDDNHTGFAWSPDSSQLAYIRYDTASYTQNREIWVMDIKTGSSQKILMDAYQLAWLP
jgi:Tol biopolymer transport system component